MSQITLSEAQEMIASYQDIRTDMLKSAYSSDVLPICITFTKAEIMDLLAQDGAHYLRVYYGVDGEQNLIENILVAADQNGEDIIPEEEYILIDKGIRCPTNCPPSSPLTP